MHKNTAPYRDQIQTVRDICASRLGRFTNSVGVAPSQTFLFDSDHLCGVQYEIGDFRTVWLIAERRITVFRKRQIIDTIFLDTDSSQRAA